MSTNAKQTFPPDKNAGHGVVFLIESPHAWRGVWQRPHHIVSRFSRRYECHYVTPWYVKNIVKNYAGFKENRKAEVNERLSIYAPILLNGERIAAVRSYNKRQVATLFRLLAMRHEGQQRILWIYNPHHAHLAESVPHERLVYDIMDEYSGFPWSPRNVVEEERALLRRADVVFAGTKTLYDAKCAEARNIHCLLSAVEFEHFHKAAEEATAIPADLNVIRTSVGAVLGYFGMVDMRLDEPMLHAIARQRKDWAIVLVGPVVGRFGLLRALPNVHFLGRRPYSELPGYAKGFDICLIPFKSDRLTRHTNPTKALEYFAAGKPVISSSIPDIAALYSDAAWIADDDKSVIDAAEQILRGQVGERIKRGVALARQRSWDAVVEEICRKLGILSPVAG
jgi:UDP-galactopyranose mutase